MEEESGSEWGEGAAGEAERAGLSCANGRVGWADEVEDVAEYLGGKVEQVRHRIREGEEVVVQSVRRLLVVVKLCEGLVGVLQSGPAVWKAEAGRVQEQERRKLMKTAGGRPRTASSASRTVSCSIVRRTSALYATLAARNSPPAARLALLDHQ